MLQAGILSELVVAALFIFSGRVARDKNDEVLQQRTDLIALDIASWAGLPLLLFGYLESAPYSHSASNVPYLPYSTEPHARPDCMN